MLLLTLKWDEPVVEGWTRTVLGAGTLAAAHAFVDAISNDRERGGDRPSVGALLTALRAEGFLVPVVTPVEPPEQAVRAAQMLNFALTNLSRIHARACVRSRRHCRSERSLVKSTHIGAGLLGGSFRGTLNTIRSRYRRPARRCLKSRARSVTAMSAR